MHRKRHQGGMTLIEVMIAAALSSMVIFFTINIFQRQVTFFKRTAVRQDVMRESRICMDTIVSRLRGGKADSLSLSASLPGQPYDRADFQFRTPPPSGATSCSIFLDRATNQVHYQEFPSGMDRVLAKHVTILSIVPPNGDDLSVVNVTLRIEAPFDESGEATHTSSLMLNQVVRMEVSP